MEPLCEGTQPPFSALTTNRLKSDPKSYQNRLKACLLVTTSPLFNAVKVEV